MSATIAQARDDMYGLIQDFWDTESSAADVELIYEDTSGQRPRERVSDEVLPWARASIRHNLGYQSTLANHEGKSRWRNDGLFVVELWFPGDKGRRDIDPFAQLLKNALQGQATTNGVWFRNVRYNEIGQDGAWFRGHVIADFQYDQVA